MPCPLQAYSYPHSKDDKVRIGTIQNSCEHLPISQTLIITETGGREGPSPICGRGEVPSVDCQYTKGENPTGLYTIV